MKGTTAGCKQEVHAVYRLELSVNGGVQARLSSTNRMTKTKTKGQYISFYSFLPALDSLAVCSLSNSMFFNSI